MRFIRLLGAVVIVYGLSYIMYGLQQLFGMVGYRATMYVIELNLSIHHADIERHHHNSTIPDRVVQVNQVRC